MTLDALLIRDTLESLIKKEIANDIIFRESEIIIKLDNGTAVKIALKNIV